MLNPKAKLHAFRYAEVFAAQIVFKFICEENKLAHTHTQNKLAALAANLSFKLFL